MIVEDGRYKENDFKSNKDKLVLRNAVNKNGGVRVKDIREQKISNFFKTGGKQTFFFITGF